MDLLKQSMVTDYDTDDFRGYASSSEFQVRGFYDYGRQKQPLRIDQVTYNLRISSMGEIVGSSNDSAGSATIVGSIDFKNRNVHFVKRYGMWNVWATWTYIGKVTENGRMIWGQWFDTQSATASLASRASIQGGNGRFGMWIENKAVDQEKACLEMLLWMQGGPMSTKQEGEVFNDFV